MGLFDSIVNTVSNPTGIMAGTFGGGIAGNVLSQSGPGGGLVGSLTGTNAANNAAAAETAAGNQAAGTEKGIYTDTVNANQPYTGAGSYAVGQLKSQMPSLTKQFTMADFQQDPGYQFNLQQGQNAIQASAAARGLLGSTNTMAGLANYSQGLASNEFQNAYNRFTQNQQQRYGMLSGLAGIGQSANGQNMYAGMNYANQAGQDITGIGNANAAAAMQPYTGMMGLANLGTQGASAAAAGKILAA